VTPAVVATARGPVEVARAGAGPAVILLHGMPGDYRQAGALARDLAGRHEVLLPSRPGYGATPLASGRGIADQADLAVALLDALALPDAAVVGISGGGPAAYAFATRHPRRCRALVLCCAVAPPVLTVPRALRVLDVVPGLWELGARRAARRLAAVHADPTRSHAASLAELGPAERVAASDPQVRDDIRTFQRQRAEVLTSIAGLRNDYRQLRAARAAGATPWPAGVRVPALVLHGADDTVVPVEHGAWYAAAIPGAAYDVVPDAGHAFVITLRRTVSPRIEEFL
jgi:pimeloyl-ACP methyl ester carboxylesterase